MNRSGTFAHTLYVLLNRLALPVGAFFLLIVIGRYSSTLLGEYALVTTYFYIMQTLPMLGLTPFVMREVARDPERAADYLVSIGSLCLISSLLVIFAVQYGLGFSVYDAQVVEAIKVVGYTIVPGILVFTCEIILTSEHKTAPIGAVAIFENISRVAISVSLLSQGYGLVSLVWVLFATRSFALLIYLCVLYKTSAQSFLVLPKIKILMQALKVAPPFLLAMVLTLVMSRMDFIVLSIFQTIEQIGHYAVAYRMYEIGLLIVSAFLTAIFPTIAKQYLGTRSHLIVAIKNFFIFVGSVLIPVTLCGLFLAEYYVNYLFPNQYPESVLLTQLFMLLFLLAGLDLTASAVLNAVDEQGKDVRAILWGSSIYTGILFLLVVPFGVYGAFAASATAVSVQFIIKLRLINQILPICPLQGEGWKLVMVVLLSIVWGLFWWGGWIGYQLLAIVIMVVLLLPLALALLGVFKPLRLACYFRKPRYPVDIDSLKDLFDTIIADRRRAKMYQFRWSNMGFFAVCVYRVSRYFYRSGRTRFAQFFWLINLIITKSDLKPNTLIGPGLVLLSPVGVVVSGNVGRNATFMAWSGTGNSGVRDVGAGPGVPVVGDNVFFCQRSVILGGHKVPDKKAVKPCAKVRSNKELIRAFQD